MTQPARSLQLLISRLPKVELHLHLEGALRPATLRELARGKPQLERATEDWISERLRSGYRYGDFQSFLEAFKFAALLLQSPADYALAATRLVELLAAENVRYAEVTLAVGVLLWKKQGVEEVFGALSVAREEAESRLGVRVNWIFDAVRQFGVDHAREVMRLASRHLSDGVVGFGIGGDEVRGPAGLFAEVYREARDLGLRLTAHAGETAGPESIRAAVEILGAERVGHGLTAIRDPEVMALLRERRIALEVCPTSNVATGLMARFEDHPLPQYLEAGLLVTLNSDDPGLFDTSLECEQVLAARHFALTPGQLVELCENAVRVSFLAEDRKGLLLEELRSETESWAVRGGAIENA